MAGRRLLTTMCGKGACSVLTGALLVSVAPMAATTASAAQPSQVAASTASTVSMLERWPVLSQGPNSLWPRVTVRSLQYLLRARGARIAVDGVFGPQTKAAVVGFQRSRHLVVNGIAEAQTWTSLIITLSRGSRGDAVRAVQDQANFRNLKNGHSLNVDGVYGPLTRAWVINFQKVLAFNDKSFPVDGIVGTRTWPPLVNEAYSG